MKISQFIEVVLFCALSLLTVNLPAKELWSWNTASDSELRSYIYGKSGVYTLTNYVPFAESGNIASLDVYFLPDADNDKRIGGTIKFQDAQGVKSASVVGGFHNTVVIAISYNNETTSIISYKLSSQGVKVGLSVDATDANYTGTGKSILVTKDDQTILYDINLAKSIKYNKGATFSTSDSKAYTVFINRSQQADGSTTVTAYSF